MMMRGDLWNRNDGQEATDTDEKDGTGSIQPQGERSKRSRMIRTSCRGVTASRYCMIVFRMILMFTFIVTRADMDGEDEKTEEDCSRRS